ncbi:MAG: class I SAM-dependent methyltransferase [Deltaproteobacteria bacterium]|nr:class I SAM-dependent methyltransferase [Deltaproteobacteria bacterium]
MNAIDARSGALGAHIVKAVRALYEVHPYPHYPLFAKPRWQDGYLTHSHFAARLAGDLLGGAAGVDPAQFSLPATNVLIGGGGEILPYIMRKWESQDHRIVTVDLSASSLRRARWRCKWYPRSIRFEHGDLDQYLKRCSQPCSAEAFSHIDVYGVLHHMANPSETLKLLGESLLPGGTVRLMVYNTAARSWIHELQRVFQLLGIDPASNADIAFALHILRLAAAKLPAVADRLGQMGMGTMSNRARFADTFLHPREARLPIATWYQAIARAGLEVVGLFDRYAELDDLANPLWHPPTTEELEARLADRRFENNLELFLVRRRDEGAGTSAIKRPRPKSWLWPYMLKAPPSQWFSYRETSEIPLPLRLTIWHAHLRWVMHGSTEGVSAMLSRLSGTALQRLVRIGAILPGQISDPGRKASLATALVSAMPIPDARPLAQIHDAALERLIYERLQHRGCDPNRYGPVIWERLHRAQR